MLRIFKLAALVFLLSSCKSRAPESLEPDQLIVGQPLAVLSWQAGEKTGDGTNGALKHAFKWLGDHLNESHRLESELKSHGIIQAIQKITVFLSHPDNSTLMDEELTSSNGRKEDQPVGDPKVALGAIALIEPGISLEQRLKTLSHDLINTEQAGPYEQGYLKLKLDPNNPLRQIGITDLYFRSRDKLAFFGSSKALVDRLSLAKKSDQFSKLNQAVITDSSARASWAYLDLEWLGASINMPDPPFSAIVFHRPKSVAGLGIELASRRDIKALDPNGRIPCSNQELKSFTAEISPILFKTWHTWLLSELPKDRAQDLNLQLASLQSAKSLSLRISDSDWSLHLGSDLNTERKNDQEAQLRKLIQQIFTAADWKELRRNNDGAVYQLHSKIPLQYNEQIGRSIIKLALQAEHSDLERNGHSPSPELPYALGHLCLSFPESAVIPAELRGRSVAVSVNNRALSLRIVKQEPATSSNPS